MVYRGGAPFKVKDSVFDVAKYKFAPPPHDGRRPLSVYASLHRKSRWARDAKRMESPCASGAPTHDSDTVLTTWFASWA
jgi:hypothetical protein